MNIVTMHALPPYLKVLMASQRGFDPFRQQAFCDSMDNGFRLAVRRVVMREVMPDRLTLSSYQCRLAFRAHASVRQSAGDFRNVNESFAKERVWDFDKAGFARGHERGLISVRLQ